MLRNHPGKTKLEREKPYVTPKVGFGAVKSHTEESFGIVYKTFLQDSSGLSSCNYWAEKSHTKRHIKKQMRLRKKPCQRIDRIDRIDCTPAFTAPAAGKRHVDHFAPA